ncbi:MAG TPA: glycosyltransferase [Anaerolineae bacterium]|nr:glycosyltransferase [Anaerolineae bacterium]
MSPLTSIIIPCHNSARYVPGLAAALRPVLAAQPERFEAIIVDDGSSDNTGQLALSLIPSAKVVRLDDRGLAAARNAGAAVAKGEFLQFLDPDDAIEPGKLELQASCASVARADVVYSDWRMVVVRGEMIKREVYAPAQAPCEMVEALLGGWWVPTHCYLFRRSAYAEIGGSDETITVWEDFDLFLRFALAGRRHVYTPGIFCDYYRYLDVTSLARRDPAANGRNRARILFKALETLEHSGGLTLSRRKAAARAFFAVLRTSGISDPQWLGQISAKIRQLDPAFQPVGNPGYRVAARLLGLINAERLAMFFRGKG